MGSIRTMAVALALFAPAAASAVDITACDQTVPKNETGILVVDLVCPSGPAHCSDAPATECTSSDECVSGFCRAPSGVTLDHRATLQLNGHSISGGAITVNTLGRVHTVRGPGNIGGALLFKERLRISDVTVSGGSIGVFSGILGRLDATNVTVTGTTFIGVRGGLIRATNLVSNGNANAGIECLKLRGDSITANDNGQDGIRCDKVIASNVTTNGNGAAGIQSGYASRLQNFTATNNDGPGYFGYFSGGRLIDSTLHSNDVLANDDIVTVFEPRLLGTTTCAGHSSQFSQATGRFGTWNLCDAD